MLVFVYIGGVRPPLFAGVSPTPYTGMHSRTVLLAPPFGPSNSDESQQPTIAADVCSRTRSRQTGRAPRGDRLVLRSGPDSLHVTDGEEV